MEIGEWTLVAVGIVGIILLIYLIKLAIALIDVLSSTRALIGSMRRQLDDLGNNPAEVIRQLNGITADLANKMRAIDPWFRLSAEVGTAIENRVAAFTERKFWRCGDLRAARPQQVNIEDVLDCASSIVRLWNRAKERR